MLFWQNLIIRLIIYFILSILFFLLFTFIKWLKHNNYAISCACIFNKSLEVFFLTSEEFIYLFIQPLKFQTIFVRKSRPSWTVVAAKLMNFKFSIKQTKCIIFHMNVRSRICLLYGERLPLNIHVSFLSNVYDFQFVYYFHFPHNIDIQGKSYKTCCFSPRHVFVPISFRFPLFSLVAFVLQYC